MASIKFDDGNTNSGSQVGINNGVINVQTEQPEPRPSPLSTVPFPPDPDFVSRDQILDQIHEKALIPGCKTVLFGLGGVGKTQLAIEYAHQVRRQSPETWVFWVHASNAARLEKSLRDLADRVKIPGRQDREVDIFQLVGNWLQDQTIGKWILILDNVDDDGLLRKPSSTSSEYQSHQTSSQSDYNILTQPPLRALLQSSDGFIIVTSRSKRVGLEIAGPRNLIEVQPMRKLEAVDLLQKKLNIGAEREHLEQLVEALELMPLAIIQAAGYITHQPRCSVLQYLEKIQKSDRDAMRLLNYEAGLLTRDWDAKNSILLTWQISFDYIQNVRPSAAGLLSLMSFFDRQGIQESVLRVQKTQSPNDISDSKMARDISSEEEEDEDGSSEEDKDFEDDITMLSDYSLISFGEPRILVTMHRLVQLTVRAWLKAHGQHERWKENFIRNLNHKFPNGEYENWEECRSLLPHVILAASQQPESNECLRQWASLLYRGAWYTREVGNFAVSTEMASRSRRQKLKMFGEEDEETLASTIQLGRAYFLNGQWEKAEELQVQVMEARKMNFGADDPYTLSSISSLALTYISQGRWEEAEKLQVQVMETRTAKFGADHPETLTSMNNLAGTYTNQGRWEEAQELKVQVLEIHTAKLGTDHLDALTSMNNLALTYVERGWWEKAEALQVQVMETRTAKLGADHPDTLTGMSNLAGTYTIQARWKEAEELQAHVMEISTIRLGADHPITLTNMNNLAATYAEQGWWEKAEKLQMHVIEARTTKLGEDHPDTLLSMAGLAITWECTDRHAEAVDLLRACVEKELQILGPAHPHTVSDIKMLLKWEAGGRY